MPTKYYALFAVAALLTLALFFIPREDCSVFYGQIGDRVSGCQKLVWPKSVLDKIR